MAELPDNINKLIHNDNALLVLGDDEFISVKRFSISKSHPQQRRDLGGPRRHYLYGTPDIHLTFTLSGYTGLYNYLNTQSTRDTITKRLPSNSWVFRLRGSATENITITAHLHTFRVNTDLSTRDYVAFDCELTVV